MIAEAWWRTITWWGDFSQVVMAGAVIGSLIYAHKAVGEAKTLREEQTRPFVVVDFDVVGGIAIYIAIENLGQTIARNVRITFTPPLASSMTDPDTHNAPALVEGIPTLPPRKRLRILLDSWPNREETDLPLRYDVRVEYDGPTGKSMTPDEYVLDLSPLLGTKVETPPIGETLTQMLAFMKQRDLREWTERLRQMAEERRLGQRVNDEHDRQDRDDEREDDHDGGEAAR